MSRFGSAKALAPRAGLRLRTPTPARGLGTTGFACLNLPTGHSATHSAALRIHEE
jgi:hypothetical protein